MRDFCCCYCPKQGYTANGLLRLLRKLAIAGCLGTFIPLLLFTIDTERLSFLRIFRFLFPCIVIGVIAVVARLVYKFRDRLGPYAKPLSVFTSFALFVEFVHFVLIFLDVYIYGAAQYIILIYFLYIIFYIYPKVSKKLSEEEMNDHDRYFLIYGTSGVNPTVPANTNQTSITFNTMPTEEDKENNSKDTTN